jgi:Transposase IS4
LNRSWVHIEQSSYVDRFYTSIDLLKSMAEKDLYLTGTMMANRLPKGIKEDKKSAVYRAMQRGDFLKSKFIYRKSDGTEATAGLFALRDGNMVYCLSNNCNNFELDECCRRGKGGIMRIPRPTSIANYNIYMGGVDLADMKRMQCSSMIMGSKSMVVEAFFLLARRRHRKRIGFVQ